MRLAEIQTHLKDLDLDAWLLYDFKGNNPIARSVAGLEEGHITRRWCLLIPQSGEPRWLYHAIECNSFFGIEGRHQTYARWSELKIGLSSLVEGCRRVAIEYSPNGEIPYISRIDGGTLELLRQLDLELIPSSDIVQLYEARWSPAALAEHEKAADGLNRTRERAIEFIRENLASRAETTEYEVQQEMMRSFDELGLITDCPPIVGVNRNSSDPHYLPSESRSETIGLNNFVLMDLWAKTQAPGAVYADITWVAWTGEEAPQKHREIFEIVKTARDCGVEFIQAATGEGRTPCGYEVDDAVRKVIDDAGYGEYFFHRTGHSIGIETHGVGVNIDNYETHDTRPLIPHIGFSIEPGIYLPEFGVRSEIDVYMNDTGPKVTTVPFQQEIVCVC